MFFGTVGLVLTGLIARKLLLRRKRDLEERAIKEQLEESRRQRRSQGRGGVSNEGPDTHNCVVCFSNPKEVRHSKIHTNGNRFQWGTNYRFLTYINFTFLQKRKYDYCFYLYYYFTLIECIALI